MEPQGRTCDVAIRPLSLRWASGMAVEHAQRRPTSAARFLPRRSMPTQHDNRMKLDEPEAIGARGEFAPKQAKNARHADPGNATAFAFIKPALLATIPTYVAREVQSSAHLAALRLDQVVERRRREEWQVREHCDGHGVTLRRGNAHGTPLDAIERVRCARAASAQARIFWPPRGPISNPSNPISNHPNMCWCRTGPACCDMHA